MMIETTIHVNTRSASLFLAAIFASSLLLAPMNAHAQPLKYEVPLMAGQNQVAGVVKVLLDGDSLNVKYEAHDGWMLLETHLAIGESTDDIPQTRSGNPRPGRFAYSREYENPIPVDKYEITLEDGYALSCIAAHAVVYNPALDQEETAWGSGPRFNDDNWATYIQHPSYPILKIGTNLGPPKIPCVVPGETYEIHIDIVNDGHGVAHNLYLTWEVPLIQNGEWMFMDLSFSVMPTIEGNKLTWYLPAVPPDSTVPIVTMTAVANPDLILYSQYDNVMTAASDEFIHVISPNVFVCPPPAP